MKGIKLFAFETTVKTIVWINPAHITHIAQATPNSGSMAVVHLSGGTSVSLTVSGEDVVRAIGADDEQEN